MRCFLLGITLFALGGALGADPRFRADDGNLWRLDDNPALEAAAGDGLALGWAYTPDGTTLTRGANDLRLISSLVSFRYSWEDATSTLKVGSAMGPWAGLSFGFHTDSIRTASSTTTSHNFGGLYRPFDLVSAGLTVDDAFTTNRVWGAGLGLRPLTLWSPRADWLTLTADAHWTPAGFAFERWGGRISWQGTDLRVWYDTITNTPGIEATLTWGPAETMVSNTTLGAALRWSSRTPEPAAFGKVLLKIDAEGTLGPVPVQPPFWSDLVGGRPALSLPALIDQLNRAALAPQVAGVVFVNPPQVEGLATAQALAQALARVRQAGKKVYIHGDDFGSSLGFQGWQAAADRVSLDPSGSVVIVSSGSRRLYWKGLFDSVGIRVYNFAPWETKSANNPWSYSTMPDGERAMLTRVLTDRDDQASAALAAARGLRLKEAARQLVTQGPYLQANAALEAGLVDAVENRADFFDWVAKAHPGIALVDHIPVIRSQAWGPTVTRRTVALVHLAGDIVLGDGVPGRSIGQDAVDVLAQLRDDANIRAVVLRVDSPGGAVLPSDALADQVRKTVAAGKPVLVLMGDVAASGGYYLSAPATRIWARPGTITGSIGVTAALFTAPQLLEKWGIHPDGVELGPSTGFGDWTRSPSDFQLAKWNAMIDATYQRFLGVVAEGRHLDKSKVEPLARGQVYTGREALSLGLVDALGGQDEAEAWLVEHLGGPIEWKPYVPGRDAPLAGLLDPLTAAVTAVTPSPTLRLAASLDQWLGPTAEVLNQAVARGQGPQLWFEGL